MSPIRTDGMDSNRRWDNSIAVSQKTNVTQKLEGITFSFAFTCSPFAPMVWMQIQHEIIALQSIKKQMLHKS